jgi:hypothetical protein
MADSAAEDPSKPSGEASGSGGECLVRAWAEEEKEREKIRWKKIV